MQQRHLRSLVLIALALPAGSVTADDLLDEAVVGQRQLREALLSVKAKMEIETEGFGTTIRREGEWWQQGASIRWRETTELAKGKQAPNGWNHTSMEGVVANGKFTGVSKSKSEGNGEKVGATIRVPGGRDAAFFNLWSRANFAVQDSPVVTLLDVLESADWKKIAKEDGSLGRRQIHIRATGKKSLYVEAWINPADGYIARRLIVSKEPYSETRPHTEFLVDAVQETTGPRQVKFPKSTKMRIFGKGRVGRSAVIQTNTSFPAVEVDPSFNTEAFAPPSIPQGAFVADHLRGIKYKAGQNGQPENPNSVTPLVPSPASEPTTLPASWWTSIFYVSCGLLLGLVGFVYWRWRQARQEA